MRWSPHFEQLIGIKGSYHEWLLFCHKLFRAWLLQQPNISSLTVEVKVESWPCYHSVLGTIGSQWSKLSSEASRLITRPATDGFANSAMTDTASLSKHKGVSL